MILNYNVLDTTKSNEILRKVVAPRSNQSDADVNGVYVTKWCQTRKSDLKQLHDGGLYTVGWGEGLWELGTPIKAIRVGVGS